MAGQRHLWIAWSRSDDAPALRGVDEPREVKDRRDRHAIGDEIDAGLQGSSRETPPDPPSCSSRSTRDSRDSADRARLREPEESLAGAQRAPAASVRSCLCSAVRGNFGNRNCCTGGDGVRRRRRRIGNGLGNRWGCFDCHRCGTCIGLRRLSSRRCGRRNRRRLERRRCG